MTACDNCLLKTCETRRSWGTPKKAQMREPFFTAVIIAFLKAVVKTRGTSSIAMIDNYATF